MPVAGSLSKPVFTLNVTSKVPSAFNSAAPAAAPPMVAMLSAGTAHFVSPVTRVDDTAPVDGCQASANLPNTTYVPVNAPASGGRDPDVAGADATNPVPRTVTVSPSAFKPDVFDTVTVGTAGANVIGVIVSNGAYFAPPPGYV